MLQGLPQLRPIDPLLTRLMVDYEAKESRYIAKNVFPYFQTEGRTGTYYKGDAENEFRYEPVEWGNNVPATSVDIKMGAASFTVYPRAYRTSITKLDEKDFIGPLSLENFVTKKLMGKFLLAKEVKAEAKLRGSSGIQSLAAGTAWNAASLDPVNDIDEASELVLKAVGWPAETVIIPPTVWRTRVMTNAANTAGKQFRDQLGYVLAMKGENVTPNAFAQWLGVDRVLVPKGPKAAGVESTTPATGGLTGTVPFIWSDTTQIYAGHIEDNPSIGTSSYGVCLGPEDIGADVPFFDWQINGNWYRVAAIQGEIETVPRAMVKITGI